MTTRNPRYGIVPVVPTFCVGLCMALCVATVPVRAAEPAPQTTSAKAAPTSKQTEPPTSKQTEPPTSKQTEPPTTPSAAAPTSNAPSNPATTPTPTSTPAAAPTGSESANAPAAASNEGTVAAARAALDKGDLSAAKAAASSARERNPNDPEVWWVEGEILEASGDYAGAVTAYRGGLKLAPTHARAPQIEARIDAITASSRGTVADEPASTHRAELDRARHGAAPVQAKPAAPRVAGAVAPVDKPESIVKKWYFWVTLAVIVGSAAAVTGLAIKAATDERDDALDASAGAARHDLSSPFVVRF